MTDRFQDRIRVDPKVMRGKPVIRGTRITVELILRQLAQGITMEEMLENYPHLTKEDLYAAIEYATGLVEEESVYPIASKRRAKTAAR